MTNEDIDTLWFKATTESIKAGEQLTRYRFAEELSNVLQKDFWEACKPYGKVGECVYLTYKARNKK